MDTIENTKYLFSRYIKLKRHLKTMSAVKIINDNPVERQGWLFDAKPAKHACIRFAACALLPNCNFITDPIISLCNFLSPVKDFYTSPAIKCKLTSSAYFVCIVIVLLHNFNTTEFD